MQGAKKKVRSVSYAKWGYVFIAPFFIVFALFQLYPLASTIYYSFFEYFFKQGGLIQVGPNPVGWANYLYVFSKDLPRYFGNTIIMWLMGFIPQIIFSLLLAAWFTDNRLKLKCQGFFKTVIYMPNLIMMSAYASRLFFTITFGTPCLTANKPVIRFSSSRSHMAIKASIDSKPSCSSSS